MYKQISDFWFVICTREDEYGKRNHSWWLSFMTQMLLPNINFILCHKEQMWFVEIYFNNDDVYNKYNTGSHYLILYLTMAWDSERSLSVAKCVMAINTFSDPSKLCENYAQGHFSNFPKRQSDIHTNFTQWFSDSSAVDLTKKPVWTSLSSSIFSFLRQLCHFSCEQLCATLWMSSRKDCRKM